jgi:uncharacterized protein (DUF58 family)
MSRRFFTTLCILGFGATALYVGLRGYTVALLGALLVLLALGVAWIWNRFVFSKLVLERTLNRRLAEFDAPVTMHLGVTNRKLLPLFGLRVRFTVSSGLQWDPSKVIELQKTGYDIFQEVFHLNWYEKRSRVYELRPTRRGRFQFDRGSLTYADPFGFFSNSKDDVFAETQLIVFPKIVPIRGLASLNTYLFGSRPKDGWIFVDPLNRIGTRPYESTDSARMINWKATARHVQTQVNVEKPSFDQQVYLVLDQPPGLPWWTTRVLNQLEIAIMTLSSLIHSYSEAGYEIRLLTNLVSKTHGTGRQSVRARRGRGQRSLHLTNLALLQSFSLEPISRVLARRTNQISPGSTVVIVTTAPGTLEPSFVKMARSLGLKSKVAVVRVLDKSDDVARERGLKEWRIEWSVPWHEVDQLELC